MKDRRKRQNRSMDIIRDHAGLVRFVNTIRGCPRIAVDTEFVREGCYYPRLALLQVAADEERVGVIDPFCASPLDELFEIFRDPGVEMIMHASRQDLEILFVRMGMVPQPIFDTQVAAAFLGYGESIGLANLMRAELGVELNKSESYTNWLQRPLSEAQLSYAADDVRDLPRLAAGLREKLEERGRLPWVSEILATLADPKRYGSDPENAYLQVRRAWRLGPRELAVLRELAAWREGEAEAQDRPRGTIATDECLLELARRQPRRADALTGMRGLGRRNQRQLAAQLVKAVKRGKAVPEEAQPQPMASREVDPELQVVVDLALALLRSTARTVEVAAAYLATSAEIQELVVALHAGNSQPDIPLLQSWRFEAAGRGLVSFLKGEALVGIQDGQVAFLPRTEP